MKNISFIFSYVKAHLLSYILGALCIFLTNYIMVLIPSYIQTSIDKLKAGEFDIIPTVTLMIALAVLSVLIRTLSRTLFFNPGRAIEMRVKNDVYSKLALQQSSFHKANPPGEMISRVTNDVSGIRLICGFGVLQIINILTLFSLAPAAMISISPELTLWTLLPVLLSFTVAQFNMSRLSVHIERYQVELKKMSGVAAYLLQGIELIKSYRMYSWAGNVFGRDNSAVSARSLKMAKFRSFGTPILNNIEGLSILACISAGASMVIDGELTIGELTAFITLIMTMSKPLGAMGWLMLIMQEGRAGINSIRMLMEEPDPYVPGNLDSMPYSKNATLFVKNLKYSYEGGQVAIDGVDMIIPPKSRIGLLGEIGSGKSTLVNCLNKYLETDRGMILLNDSDINDIPFNKWRKYVRTVSQDAFLFSGSMKENILMGTEDTEEDLDLSQLYEKTCLADEIKSFPNGEQTQVGEKGIMLSGGQKQRISLARAIIGNFELLILDNVLSAVDYETENKLLKTLNEASTDKSMLIVSHRVKALSKTDFIYVMKSGKIVEKGNHDHLMKMDGYYAETWRIQNSKERESADVVEQKIGADQ